MTTTDRTLTTVADLKALHDTAYHHIDTLQEAVDAALLAQDDADANASDLHEVLELYALFRRLNKIMDPVSCEIVDVVKEEAAEGMGVALPDWED